MTIDQAKRLLEIQSGIDYLLEEFRKEAEKIDVKIERESLRRSVAEVIGTCVCDIVVPITSQHPSLDRTSGNPVANQWWVEARKRLFKMVAQNA